MKALVRLRPTRVVPGMTVGTLLCVLPACIEVPVQDGSGTSAACTVTFQNETSGTTVRQILLYYPSRPLQGTEYLDVDVAPGESYSFDASTDKGTIYLCVKRGEGHGCLRDFYIDDPRPWGAYEETLTDSNCGACY